MHIKNIFFDFDGVLLNSINAHKSAFVKALNYFNIFDENFNYFPGQSSLFLIGEYLKSRDIYDEKLTNNIVHKKQSIVRSDIEKSLPVYENQIEVLLKMSEDYNLSIVSSSSYYLIDKFLKKYGFKDIFIHIVSFENTKYSKPHPEPYLVALEMNKAKIENTIVVEDSDAGIISARQAGLTVIRFNPPLESSMTAIDLENINCHSYNDIYDAILQMG